MTQPVQFLAFTPASTSFDFWAGVDRSALGGSLAILLISIATSIWRIWRFRNVDFSQPDDLLSGAPACLEQVKSTLSKCVSGSSDIEPETPLRNKEVRLVYKPVWKNTFLPPLTWTSHWAVKVDGVFYEMRSARREERKLGGRLVLGAESDETRTGHKTFVNISMGITHLSHKQLEQIGNTHALRYRWDPLVRNCQTFLHEAYFGRGMLKPLFRKQEIRCPLHGALPPMPNFTIQILASLFSLVVILEQGVQWCFDLQLSATTLILKSVPVVLSIAFTAPALYLMAMSIWNQRGIVGEALKQTMMCPVSLFRT